MNIQTISIVIPTLGCVNKCKACVSRMHNDSGYKFSIDREAITRRLKWAVMNGVNTCILTGTGEALQNKSFLLTLAEIFEEMGHPFPNVELQTTGVFLTTPAGTTNTESFRLLNRLGVSTISLSIWDIFEDKLNMEVIDVNPKLAFTLPDLVRAIKLQNMNVRFSLNMTKAYDGVDPKVLLALCKKLGADQVTFRKLYHNGDYLLLQTIWVRDNACSVATLDKINQYIQGVTFKGVLEAPGAGKHLYDLPFGGKVYSVNEMSVVMDDDCMSKNYTSVLKYVILRENGKLYSQWDDKGSLIF